MKQTVDVLSQIAQLKEVDYKNTLMITSLIEVLVDKGIIVRKKSSKSQSSLTNLLKVKQKGALIRAREKMCSFFIFRSFNFSLLLMTKNYIFVVLFKYTHPILRKEKWSIERNGCFDMVRDNRQYMGK